MQREAPAVSWFEPEPPKQDSLEITIWPYDEMDRGRDIYWQAREQPGFTRGAYSFITSPFSEDDWTRAIHIAETMKRAMDPHRLPPEPTITELFMEAGRQLRARFH